MAPSIKTDRPPKGPLSLPQLQRHRAHAARTSGLHTYPSLSVPLGLGAANYVLAICRARVLGREQSRAWQILQAPTEVHLKGYVQHWTKHGIRRLPVFRISRGARWADFALTHGSSTEPITPIDSNI